MNYDIDLKDLGDDNLDELLGNSDSDSIVSQKVKDNRNPEELVTNAGKFTESFTNSLIDGVTIRNTLVNKVLPDKLQGPLSDLTDLKDTITDVYDDAINLVRPKLRDLTKHFDKVTPKDSMFRSIIDSAKATLGTDDDSVQGRASRGPSIKEAADDMISRILPAIQEDSIIKSAINTEIQLKSSHKEQSLLSEISVNTGRALDFNYSITNKYFRKALELQYRHLFVAKESLEMSKTYYDLNKNQLDAVVKNTALPDFVKLRSTEALKASFRNTQVSAIQETLFGKGTFVQDLSTGIKKKAKALLGDVGGGLDSFKEQLQQNEEMAEFGGGTSNAELAGELGSEGLLNILGAKAGRTLNRSSFVRGKSDLIDDVFSDLPGFLNRAENNPDTNPVLRSAAGLINFLTEKTGKDLDINNLDRGGLEESSFFDNRTKDSITLVIPGLLSRIFGEVKALRTGDEPENINYDFDRKVFSTSKKSKPGSTVTGEEDKIIRKFEETGVESGYKQILNTLMKDVVKANPDISNKESSVIKNLLISRNLSNKQGGIDSIKKDREFRRLSDEDKQRITDILENTVSGKTKEDKAGKRSSFNKRLSRARGKITDPKQMIRTMIKSGRVEELINLNIIRHNPKNNSFIINDKEAARYMSGGLRRNVKRTDDDLFIGPEKRFERGAGAFSGNFGPLNKDESSKNTSGSFNTNKSKSNTEGMFDKVTRSFNEKKDSLLNKTDLSKLTKRDVIKILKEQISKNKDKAGKLFFNTSKLSKLSREEVIGFINRGKEGITNSDVFKSGKEKSESVFNTVKNKVTSDEVKDTVSDSFIKGKEKAEKVVDSLIDFIGSKTKRDDSKLDTSTSDKKSPVNDNTVLTNLQIISDNTGLAADYLDTILSEIESFSIERKGVSGRNSKFRDFIKNKVANIRKRRDKVKSSVKGVKASVLGFVSGKLGGIAKSGKSLLGKAGSVLLTPVDIFKKALAPITGIANFVGKSAISVLTGALGLAGKAGKDIISKLGKSLTTGSNITKSIGKKGFSFLFGSRNRAIDLYIPGEDTPVIRANLMKIGGYVSSKTGEVVQKLSDLVGDIIDRQGNLVITGIELSKGLVDKDGNKIKVGDNVSSGLIGGAFKVGKNILKGVTKKSMSLVKGLFKGKDPKETAQETAVATQITAESMKETNSWLEKIHTSVVSLIPKKPKFIDEDGDGLRDSGFRARLKKVNKKREKKEKERKEKDSGGFNIMDMVGKIAPLIIGLVTSAVTGTVDSAIGIGKTVATAAGSMFGAKKIKDILTKTPTNKVAKATTKAAVKKAAGKTTAKTIAKVGAKTIGKSVLKKLPLLGALAGIAFAADRLMDGDMLGAGGELLSGLLGATGFGIPASLAIDAALAARDAGLLEDAVPPSLEDQEKEAMKGISSKKPKAKVIGINKNKGINNLIPSSDVIAIAERNITARDTNISDLMLKREKPLVESTIEIYVPRIDVTLLSIDDTLKKSLKIQQQTIALVARQLTNSELLLEKNINGYNGETTARGNTTPLVREDKELNSPKVSMSRTKYR